MAKYKHLKLSERIEIYTLLSQGKSIRKIAKELKRDPTTIAKEIKKHLIIKETGSGGRHYNPCKKAVSCKKRNQCDAKYCYSMCAYCGRCITYCKDYEEHRCERHSKPPYCCNGCPKTRSCQLQKKYYNASSAHNEYLKSLSKRRKGFLISEEEAQQLERVITLPILRGQSVHHVCNTHKDELTVCKKTIYNYIDGGVFELKNIDLPRKVRYRIRKKPKEYRIDIHCREGRTYEDYMSFMRKNDVPIVQMDTVKGRIAGSVLLTIHFVSCGFMIAFLRPANTSKSVIDVFDTLDKLLGRETFRTLFPAILTDNGSEFSNPMRLEFDKGGERRTHIFYCERNRPDQKGSIEVTHEFIRRILPKGVSFDKLTQNKVNLMMSHINSYNRKKLNESSPYKVFELLYSKEILDKLGIVYISSDDINLTPKLLKN